MIGGKWHNLQEQAAGRCINVDWLEVYCEESLSGFPHNADFFRSAGWRVDEREYGTRVYNEMFKLLDHNELPFLEIRRNPVSSDSSAMQTVGIFSPYSCHIRLSNRYCYHPECVTLLSEFLMRYNYTVRRIFRLDLALDFEKFDSGDDPNRFMQRYVAGKYSKINQGNLSGHAKDMWTGRFWNSLSWGSSKSMVSTKFYCKTLELRETKDKPYIRYAWMAAGLVDDYVNLTRRAEDGTIHHPEIWRVEFSIRGNAHGWYKIEDETTRKSRRLVREHLLGTYATKLQQLEAFAFLAHHYFHFKHYEEGVRKDRCRDKVLFDFGLHHNPYKLDVLLTDTPQSSPLQRLKARLLKFRLAHPNPSVYKAVDLLLSTIEQELVRNTLPDWFDHSEASVLQSLIAMRLRQNPKEPLAESLFKVKTLLSQQLF